MTAKICAAINSAPPRPRTPAESDTAIQRLFEATEQQGAPLPKAELRFETGTMRLDSRFYVVRTEDALVLEQVKAQGTTVIIKGVRQVGKSSLLARAAAAAREAGARTFHVDLQDLETSHLKDLDSLLLGIADLLAAECPTLAKPETAWNTARPKRSLTIFLEQALQTQPPTPLVLLLDEVDLVFEHAEYRDGFFSMIRSWHNRRATHGDPWSHLNLVIAHSTEPTLWIQDITQSPFNVGEHVRLQDFTPVEVADLNQRYGSPLAEAAVPQLLSLLGGHPFLIRQAFDYLARRGWTFPRLQQHASDSDGPFGDHLKHYVLALSRDQTLKDAFKSILQSSQCAEESHFHRLTASGLIRGSERTEARPRCQLYADYFPRHL